DDKIFNDYSEKKIVNAFIQKPIRISDLMREIDSQLKSLKIDKNNHDSEQIMVKSKKKRIPTVN
ncbi:MAG TPA: hypothetical protein VF248_06095, partial [Nitrososphaeraceae archaeon]